jgi:hypothetical protein
MSEEIIKVLDDLSERFGVAIDWSTENVLPYAQELFQKFVNYEIWTSVLWLVIGLAIILFLLWGVKCCIQDSEGEMVLILFFAILFTCAVPIIQAVDIITALTFPEKLLFDYINSMQY